jgi:polyisoprenoid-binding protein YceI
MACGSGPARPALIEYSTKQLVHAHAVRSDHFDRTEHRAPSIPGYEAATWNIDPVDSEVGFSVRHMMVSKVRGRFTGFRGQIITGENPAQSSVTAEIDLASINTGQEQRDEDIKSPNFLEVETYPTMTTSRLASGSRTASTSWTATSRSRA